MRYVITGSLGHISKPVTMALLQAGHTVTVITSKKENIPAIEGMGAKALAGTVEDAAFVTQAFAGADAVYTMVPPKLNAPDWKAYISSTGKIYADAIKANAVKHVVNLSSVGAHMPEGCGPVSGLFFVEKYLNESGANVLHVRAPYFYYNLFSNIAMIKNAGIMGGNFAIPQGKFPVADTSDIANEIANALLQLNFTGTNVKYITSDVTGTDEIASLIGEAVGKPGLAWVQFTDEQALQGMVQAGLPQEVAKNYVEMSAAMHSGTMMEDYFKNQPATYGKVKIEDFAKQFAAAYNAS
jgi:uncharacterized protein YbjT (DUF2867 family)